MPTKSDILSIFLGIMIFTTLCTMAILFHIDAKFEKLEEQIKKGRDYQVEFRNPQGDLSIWDGNRRIGVLEYSDSSKLHELLLNDNQ